MLAVAAVAASVTLSVSVYIGGNQQRVHVFSGTVSNRAAGEYVEVLGRYCGKKADRLIAGTLTQAGGRWRVENPRGLPNPAYTPVYSGTVFRARWHGEYSRPFDWRVLALPQVAKIAGTRTWIVHVVPATPWGDVGFEGKPVELQRLTPGGWKLVRSAVLTRKQSGRWGVFNYEARFTVPTRGLRLRAYLPDESASPCFRAGGSRPWWS